jgi:hypothetical protein
VDPYGRILGFLDRSRYFFFQVAPQLYSRGCVDPVPDPLLLRKSGSTGNRTRASGSVAKNSWLLDHRGGQLYNIQCKIANNVSLPKDTREDHSITSLYMFSVAILKFGPSLIRSSFPISLNSWSLTVLRLTFQLLNLLGKSTRCQLDRRLDGSQSRSGCYENEVVFTLAGKWIPSSRSSGPYHSHYTDWAVPALVIWIFLLSFN